MHKEAIGECAGKLWRQLAEKGRMPVSSLVRGSGGDPSLAQQAIGWLAREDKIQISKQGRSLFVELVEAEAEVFRIGNGIQTATR